MTEDRTKLVEEKPQIKLLMQKHKWMLIHICRDRNISTEGTKFELAKRIALVEEKEFSDAWRAIANGRHDPIANGDGWV
jgi:hypothetical protein